MVLVSTPSDFLLADARAALRRQLEKSCRTALRKAFAKWILDSPTDAEFISIVNEAAATQGAQQDYQTVAILGFALHAGSLSEVQIESTKTGLQRLSGRAPVVDGVRMAFCLDAIGILGIVLGTKIVADPNTTSAVINWTSRFLKNSYEMSLTDDHQRCLLAVADRQLGNPQNLAIPMSATTADIRTALMAKDLMDAGTRTPDDDEQTLRLALSESQNELNCDRAALRMAAVAWVLKTAVPVSTGKKVARSPNARPPLSSRDMCVHDLIGKHRFCTLSNSEIMNDLGVKKRLRGEFKLEPGKDATKSCLDRIRNVQGYPLSSEVKKKRSTQQ